MNWHITNISSPSSDTVYVTGGYKKELEKILDYKVRRP